VRPEDRSTEAQHDDILHVSLEHSCCERGFEERDDVPFLVLSQDATAKPQQDQVSGCELSACSRPTSLKRVDLKWEAADVESS
jgi:hypothetical protein